MGAALVFCLFPQLTWASDLVFQVQGSFTSDIGVYSERFYIYSHENLSVLTKEPPAFGRFSHCELNVGHSEINVLKMQLNEMDIIQIISDVRMSPVATETGASVVYRSFILKGFLKNYVSFLRCFSDPFSGSISDSASLDEFINDEAINKILKGSFLKLMPR